MLKGKKLFILISVIVLIIISSLLYFVMNAVSDGELSFRAPIRILHTPKITWAEPEAEMRNSEDADWIEVEPGMRLDVDGYVRTGRFGNVDISFLEGTLIRIAENTIVSLSDLTLSKIDVKLETGSLISKFSKITGNEIHKIITPEVVCGIRGTELIIETSGDTTFVYGMSGVTEVASIHHQEKPVLLGFQQKTTVKTGAPPVSPEKMTTEEITRYRHILDSMHSDEVFFITSDLKFNPDSDELVSDSMEMLEDLSSTIRMKKLKIEIVGHTADVGDRSAQYLLSRKRAEAVKDALVILGVKENNLTTAGYGGSKPIADNDTPEGRALNRRVEFLIAK